jgi:hypothetical protein
MATPQAKEEGGGSAAVWTAVIDWLHVALMLFAFAAPWVPGLIARESQGTLLLFYIFVLADWSADAECSLTLLARPNEGPHPRSFLETRFGITPESAPGADAAILGLIWLNTLVVYHRVMGQAGLAVFHRPWTVAVFPAMALVFVLAKVSRWNPLTSRGEGETR